MTQSLPHDLLAVVRDLAEKHELHIEKDGRAVSILVRELMRLALTLAKAADQDVTGVLVHVVKDNKIAVSVRHGPHDWLEVVVKHDA